MSDSMRPRPDVERVTICVNTVDRPYCVQRFIRSVRAVYPTISFIVADQNEEEVDLQKFYDEMKVKVVRVPYGSGVGYGRNAAAREVDTEFILYCDDDFLFSEETDFSPAIRIFEADPDIDILGGLVRDVHGRLESPAWAVRRFESFMIRDPMRGLVYMAAIDYFELQRREVAGMVYFVSDTALNWKICRRTTIERGAVWDPRFVCNGEHEDFYLNVKENTDVKVAYLPSLVVYHHSPDSESYYRLRNANEGWRLFEDKWGVSELIETRAALHVIFRDGWFDKPKERTRDPLIQPDHSYFEFDRERLGADRPTCWPATEAKPTPPDPTHLSITLQQANPNEVLLDQNFSMVAKIHNASSEAWGCLGQHAPELSYSLYDAFDGLLLSRGVRATRLAQDIGSGTTFHYVNFDMPPNAGKRLLPGDSLDLRVELRRPDGTTAVASQFHRIRLSSSATKYEARLNDRIDLNRQGLPSVVRAIIGLSFMEDWGRWSDANISEAVEFHFNSDLPENFDLVIHYWAFGPNAGKPILVRCGQCTAAIVASSARETVRVRLRPLTRARVITITPPYPTRPADSGENNDQRRLGIALISVQIEEAGGALPAEPPASSPQAANETNP